MTTAAPLATSLRTHPCGALRLAHAGESVRLGGWVHRTRNLGGLVFMDLRDRAGIVQVSFNPETTPEPVMQLADRLTPETVVLVEGVVVARPPEGRNPRCHRPTPTRAAVPNRLSSPHTRTVPSPPQPD